MHAWTWTVIRILCRCTSRAYVRTVALTIAVVFTGASTAIAATSTAGSPARISTLRSVNDLKSVANAVRSTSTSASASCANPIACENELPGTPQSVWDASQPGPSGPTIQGFADPFSVSAGQTVNFRIETSGKSYAVDIYRMGYYGGDGARLEASITPNVAVSQAQPACNKNTATGLVDCGDWSVSASWTVPSTAVSGVYFAHIYRTDGSSDDSQIPFVVNDPTSHSDVLFKTSDTTWQAYNDWGGYSLYTGDATDTANSALDPGRAEMVSYNRPFATRWDTPNGEDFFFANEFPMIEFLEENGYDVSYSSSGDVGAVNGAAMLEQHKVLLSVGHDEYWTGPERDNVQAAANAGVNLAFFSGNAMYWKTRWAPSQYGNEANRTLVTYKESIDSAHTDPADPPTWTGLFRDTRFSPPSDGGDPENALQGTISMVIDDTRSLQVPSQYSKLRFWRNTSVAGLQSGQTVTMPAGTLGYEWDEDLDNGFRPAGLVDMSSTTGSVEQVLQDDVGDTAAGTATHHLTLYRASSGALVFGAGDIQWPWGLNANHDGDGAAASPDMEQATVNILADMSAQPANLESGLAPAVASTDHTPPTSTISSPSSGANLTSGSKVTISGSATDLGGGVVAGVEVSTNGGSTWHPVTTMSAASASVTWSYTWEVSGTGAVRVESRATDDSANIETPSPGVPVNVACPCSLFSQDYTPSVASENDATPIEAGIKFQSSIAGWVAGVRFYKGSGNAGTHTGSLWTDSGTLLATGTFTNETATGWQTLLFANPIQISANTTYVASYFAPDGHYSADPGLLNYSSRSTPPLTALQTGTDGPNGVYNAGGPGFPTATYQGPSYAVDVVFDTTQPPGAPPAVTDAEPYPGSSSDALTVNPSVTFSKPVVPSTVSFTLKGPNGNAVAGSLSLDGTNTIATFAPATALAAGTAYTATVSGAQDQFGQLMAPYTYSFITAKVVPAFGTCPCSLWTDDSEPTASDSGDANQVEVGVKFTAKADGKLLGIRFYKNRNNTGVHTGSLWTASGALLATGTFTNESTEGWQELVFTTPVSITAGTEYVASYHTAAGHYSATSGGLASGFTNGPLTALAGTTGGGNGVYQYGASAFPTNSYNAANYWVDVVYQPNPDPNPPAVASTSPSEGGTSEQLGTSVSVTFNKVVKAGSASLVVTGPGGTTVSGTSALDSSGTVLTFTPGSGLAAGTTYTATVAGAANNSGVPMASPYSWSFTTSGVGACPCTLFPSDAIPQTPAANDSGSVNLGLTFSADVNGWITGIRFYKGSGNTGTHVGTLWTTSGNELASGTFTSETSNGWQTLIFAEPIAIVAGQSYVVSYLAPNGHYAVNAGFFSGSGYDNSPLHAPQSGVSIGNGVYAYGSKVTFPEASYGGSNYWVDPIFWSTEPPSLIPPSVVATSPVADQTSVPPNGTITAQFNKAVQASTISFSVTDKSNNSVPGTVSYNAASESVTFTPTNSLAYDATYTATVASAIDNYGNTMTSPYTWNFTTAVAPGTPGQCPCSIWADSALPSVPSVDDPGPVELGVKFQADVSGWITGIRFYKGSNNTGTHVGSLWSSDGTLLAQATFTNESAAGWQEVDFATPVPVTADTTYIASYFAPSGGYAADAYQFTNAGVDNPPLHALPSAAAGGNGVYLYTSSPGFPTSASTSNYWVDVVFATTTP